MKAASAFGGLPWRPLRGLGASPIAWIVPLAAAAAVALAALLDRPEIGLALFLAALAGPAALWAGRRLGGLGLWIGVIALSILAGELSAVSIGGQNGKLLWADAVLGLGTAWVLVRQRLVIEMPRASTIAAPAALAGWFAMTLLFARDTLTGVAELKEWLAALAVGIAALHHARNERRALELLWIVSLTAALVGGLMVVSAALSPMGWVLAILLKKVDLPWGRTNYLAGILILAIPVALGLLGEARSWKARVAVVGMLLAQLTGLALSASKGAILSMVLGLLLAFVPGGRSARWGLALMAAVIAAAVGLFTLGPLHQVIAYRLQASALEYSVGERLDLYRLAWDSFVRSPIVGLGLNNFSVASNRLTGVDTVPHNLELGFLAESGLPGLLLAALWIGGMASHAWRARRSVTGRGTALGTGLWAAFLSFLIHNQVESTLYGEQYKILLILVAVATWRWANPGGPAGVPIPGAVSGAR